jgi:Flp pilus assembly pilin Flp
VPHPVESQGRRVRKQFRRFLREEDSGQATVEYILLLAFCALTAVAMSKGILGALDRGVLRLGGQLERDLKSGRAPLGIWSN